MKTVTKKEALEIIKNGNFTERTFYFGYKNIVTGKIVYIDYEVMKETLCDCGFGKAESEFIVASMVLAGAKLDKAKK